MTQEVQVPHGEEKITIELTVKEAMALTGMVKFNQQPELLPAARKKLKETVENKVLKH